ncbi:MULTISPECIES: hypothetical protein [unclassified Actinoplanes]|uniref:hypothetical protein n=1 Tax=unclassified Actinoplanes TaxID=2626549 RepID=UPI0009C1AEF3|nr:MULTISPECIES: hypothetical protein [unclassified Actinoplanes]SLM02717.1 hypothetical protein ACSP50_5999 [Actinoplanes sp. SE50/110]
MTRRPDPMARRQSQPRADLVHRSAPFLPSDSEIRQVFIYQTAANFLIFVLIYLTGLAIFWAKYRCVAVTQDAIYVLESSKVSGGGKPQRLIGTLPRRTQLGPMSGRWSQMKLLGEQCWVHKRFHDQVAAADREAGFTA